MLTIFYYELEFTPSRIAFSDDSAAARSMGGKFAEDGTEGGGEGGEEEMKATPDPISSRLGLIEKKAQPEKVVHVPPRREDIRRERERISFKNILLLFPPLRLFLHSLSRDYECRRGFLV